MSKAAGLRAVGRPCYWLTCSLRCARASLPRLSRACGRTASCAPWQPRASRLLLSLVLRVLRCLVNLVWPKWTAYAVCGHARSRLRPSHPPTTRSPIRATPSPQAPFTCVPYTAYRLSSFLPCLSFILYFYCGFPTFSYTNAQRCPAVACGARCGRRCADRRLAAGAAAARAARARGRRCRPG